MARQGAVRLGNAWQGKVRNAMDSCEYKHCMARLGEARQGSVGHGWAGYGMATLGLAQLGTAW